MPDKIQDFWTTDQADYADFHQYGQPGQTFFGADKKS